MFIGDTFKEKGKVYAACSGEGITRGWAPKKIKAGDRIFSVDTVNITESFIGVLQAMLILSGNDLPPLGEITVLQ